MRGGTSADGGKTVRWSGGPRSLTLERSAATDVRFQPGTTTILDFRLVEATTPTNQRPDLGIGGDDVAIDKHGVTLTVQDRKSTTSELQSLMRISYAVFCLKKKIRINLYHLHVPHVVLPT